jgi:hypothetical protein
MKPSQASHLNFSRVPDFSLPSVAPVRLTWDEDGEANLLKSILESRGAVYGQLEIIGGAFWREEGRAAQFPVAPAVN